MKKRSLTTAILAGLTGLAGMVGSASAVNVNPDGLGEVLLYPVYSARGGNQTLISLVNTTSSAKAVKVRFLEAENSLEVLDFNLYLSPFDVWAAAVADQIGGENGVAELVVPDTSCTSPFLPAGDTPGTRVQQFQTLLVDGDGDRTLSGHFEVIEMGVLSDEPGFTPATWVTHVDNPDYDPEDPSTGPARLPIDCQSINDAWSTIAGVPGAWIVDESRAVSAPTGGLFGGGAIVNVDDGSMFGYNATAIDGFFTGEGNVHTDPGNLEPDLTGDPAFGITRTESNSFINGDVVTSNWAGAPSDLGTLFALNAVLTQETFLNEYVYGPSQAAARTEWVLTFPTKTFHVNPADVEEGSAVPPFTSVFGSDGACEEVFFNFNLFDREEDSQVPGSDTPVVSPAPTPGSAEDFLLCFETQVIRFGDEADLDDPDESFIFKEPLDRLVNVNIADESLQFDSGWARFSFNPINDLGETEDATADNGGNATLPSDEGDIYQGLPMIGFGVTRFSNSTIDIDGDGEADVLSNYAGAFDHRGTRRVTNE